MAPEKTDKKRGALGHVVVVGGNGFLGHYIVDIALSQWTTTAVTSIDLRCDRNVNPAAAYRECDITDAARLAGLLDELRPDVVIHTASPVVDGGKTSNALFDKVNVEGTRSVIDACRKAGVRALVYTSSASVISDNQHDLYNADERWPVIRGAAQTEYYSETKAAAEELVINANRAEASPNLLTTSIRPSGIFGEGDVQTLAGFLRAYHNGKTGVQIGDNTNIFDFTYAGNVAHAHLLAAAALLATAKASTVPLDYERVDGEVFFVTNDEPVYFWDFARAVWTAAGDTRGKKGVWVLPRDVGLALGSLSETFYGIIRKPAVFTSQRATMASMTRYYNIAKAKRALGYEPLWTLQEGINKGVRWALEHQKEAAIKA
ncbi:Sterol-4-alpha-carboxylate 3-dehydrogenase, decarboxylating [Paramyrothecium foliicola]|nr:Sterol-4-alpha-carboxylate 3-dehydrogenase, decarboxylating [Paramyrothecium foliicola]